MKKRFPKGYWEDIDNVKTHLQPYIETMGRLPKHRELTADGLSMLSKAITIYHGGIETLSGYLGIPTALAETGIKPRNFWTHERSVKLIHKYLILSRNPQQRPTKKELTKFNPSFVTAIRKFTLTQLLEDYQRQHAVVLTKPQKKTKWTEEQIDKSILKLVNEFSYIPSNSELAKLGLDGLRGAIAKTGGLNYFANKLNVPTKTQLLGNKPKSYWLDMNNVKKEMLPIIDKIGHFPSYNELIALGKKELLSAYTAQGGIKSLSEKLGIEIDTAGLFIASDGHYLRSRYEVLFDNFLSINAIQHETEGLITDSENYFFDFKLKTLNQTDVYVEIWGYSDRHNTKRAIDYNTKRKIKERLYKKLGFTLISLEEEDFDKPFAVIYKKLSELIINYEIKTHLEPINNALDYFIGNIYSFKDLQNELQPHIDKLGGKMPTTTYLTILKAEGLKSKIQKYGGFPFVAQKLSIEMWDKNDNQELATELGVKVTWPQGRFEEELDDVAGQLGYIPTQAELLKMGRGDLLGRLNLSGGSQKAAEILGYPTKSEYSNIITKHGFDNWEIFKATILKITNEIGRFPSTSWLRVNNYRTLERYIYKYGGIDKVAGKIGYKSQNAKINRWIDKDYCISSLTKLAENLRKTPTRRDLKENGLSGLEQALKRHFGGLRNATIIAGLSPKRPPTGYWQDFDNVKAVILEINKKLGHYPSQEDLKNEGYAGMVISIYRYHGGLKNIKRKIM